jgi:hypothetical protein
MEKSWEDQGSHTYNDKCPYRELKLFFNLLIPELPTYRTPQQIAAQKRLQQTQAQVDEVIAALNATLLMFSAPFLVYSFVGR